MQSHDPGLVARFFSAKTADEAREVYLVFRAVIERQIRNGSRDPKGQPIDEIVADEMDWLIVQFVGLYRMGTAGIRSDVAPATHVAPMTPRLRGTGIHPSIWKIYMDAIGATDPARRAPRARRTTLRKPPQTAPVNPPEQVKGVHA